MYSTVFNENQNNLARVHELLRTISSELDTEVRRSFRQKLEEVLASVQNLQEWLRREHPDSSLTIAARRKPTKQRERLDAIEREYRALLEERRAAEELSRRPQHHNPLHRTVPPQPAYPAAHIYHNSSEAQGSSSQPSAYMYRPAGGPEARIPGVRADVRPSSRQIPQAYPGQGVMIPNGYIPQDLRGSSSRRPHTTNESHSQVGGRDVSWYFDPQSLLDGDATTRGARQDAHGRSRP